MFLDFAEIPHEKLRDFVAGVGIRPAFSASKLGSVGCYSVSR